MKVKALVAILTLSFLSLSCVVSPDQMLTSFNDNLYENKGNGIYMNPTGASINTKLIPMDVYPVKEHDSKRLVISEAYYDYKWTIKDNKTEEIYNIVDGFYIVYIGKPIVDLLSDRTYTLTLFARNRNGVLFTDSATIKVVK